MRRSSVLSLPSQLVFHGAVLPLAKFQFDNTPYIDTRQTLLNFPWPPWVSWHRQDHFLPEESKEGNIALQYCWCFLIQTLLMYMCLKNFIVQGQPYFKNQTSLWFCATRQWSSNQYCSSLSWSWCGGTWPDIQKAIRPLRPSVFRSSDTDFTCSDTGTRKRLLMISVTDMEKMEWW